MRPNWLLFLTLFSLLIIKINAQSGDQHPLSPEVSDSVNISSLLNLAYDLSRRDLDKAFTVLKQADSVCLESGLTRMRPYIDYHYAMLHRNKGEFEQALLYVGEFLQEMQTRSDSLEIMKGLNVQTTIYYEMTDYAATLESALKLKAWSERIDNIRGQIGGISFMALVMSDRDQTDKAIAHYHQAIELCLAAKDTGRLANMYNNLAGAYLKQKDYNEALTYYRLTKEIDEKDGYTWGIFNSYHNIGNVQLHTKEFDQAFNNLQKAYDLQKEIGSIQELNMTENKLGYAAAKLGKSEGIPLLKHALEVSRENDYLHEEEQTLKYLSEVYEDRNDLTKALSYHKAYKTLSDKIYRQQVDAKTDELQVQYETAEKEQEIASLSAENKIQVLELNQARQMKWALMLGLLGLALFAALLYRNNRFRRQVNAALTQQNILIEQNLAEKEMLLKEIHHRVKNNLQIVSSLLNLQSRNVHDEAARDAMREGQNRVKSMAIIHQNLYQEDDLIGVDTGQYIAKLTDSLRRSYNIDPDRISITTDIEAGKQDVDLMIPLGLITNELISNALKHAFTDGRQGHISVSLKRENNNLKLSVKDNGVGIPDKDVSNTSASMGMKIVHAFTSKLKGQLSVHEDEGTEFILKIPVGETDAVSA